MASRVNICCVNILDNPAMFTDKFKLEITFEVFEHLPHDLEWELVYVGSGTSREYDQALDSVVVGPVPEGRHKFVFETDPPKPEKIPTEDLVGVSVLLLRCKYNEQEFLNLGWFVSSDYTNEELKQNPPPKPIVEKLTRTVQTDDLRVTTFAINWSGTEAAEYLPEPAPVNVDVAEADLMPLHDEEDDEEDDEESEGESDAEVDLNDSFEKINKQIPGVLAGAEDEEKAVADEPMEESCDINNSGKSHEVGEGEAVEMEQETANLNLKTSGDSIVPLLDKTNDACDQ